MKPDISPNNSLRGMTLIELTVSVAIFTMVMGGILSFSLIYSDTSKTQDLLMNGQDECRRTLQLLVPDIRQSVRSSINWAQLPGESFSYSVADDVDNSGAAITANDKIETSLPRVIGRDLNDVNGDTFKETQLICTSNGKVRVLANGLAPESEQLDANGVFSPAQDPNGNGRLDRGIWFEPWGTGIRITVECKGTDRRGHPVYTSLQEVVVPRN